MGRLALRIEEAATEDADDHAVHQMLLEEGLLVHEHVAVGALHGEAAGQPHVEEALLAEGLPQLADEGDQVLAAQAAPAVHLGAVGIIFGSLVIEARILCDVDAVTLLVFDDNMGAEAELVAVEGGRRVRAAAQVEAVGIIFVHEVHEALADEPARVGIREVEDAVVPVALQVALLIFRMGDGHLVLPREVADVAVEGARRAAVVEEGGVQQEELLVLARLRTDELGGVEERRHFVHLGVVPLLEVRWLAQIVALEVFAADAPQDPLPVVDVLPDVQRINDLLRRVQLGDARTDHDAVAPADIDQILRRIRRQCEEHRRKEDRKKRVFHWLSLFCWIKEKCRMSRVACPRRHAPPVACRASHVLAT